MAIRRPKLSREANLTLVGCHVIDMPPGWTFIIDCPHHGKIHLDFNPYRKHGREELASHIRDAVWVLRHEVVGNTLKTYKSSHLRTFWRFLDDQQAIGISITHLNQIDRSLLDRYRAWLELQVVAKGKRKGQKWSIGAKKKGFNVLKTLLINRQKLTPDATSPDLSFPVNPYPNTNRLSPKREPYSETEQKRIIVALNKDLRAIHEGEGEPLNDLQVLTVHLLILGLATGRNLQSLIELQRDSLQEHPLPDRELLVTKKRRGWSTQATAFHKAADPSVGNQTLFAIPASIGDHFRFVCEFTAPLTDEVADANREMVFLWRGTQKVNKGQVMRLNGMQSFNAVTAFARRHDIQDDNGQPLVLNMARLRPTFATELYRRTRDIRCVQQALGHARAETTARHYVNVPLEAERDHSIVLENMVNQYTRMVISGKVLLAADGQNPLQDVQELLSGGYNTGIARCRNPFRENEMVCKKFFACFTCPSMIVFEDDLWRLFSFYYRLLSERTKLSPPQWLKTYGPIIRRIDIDIASQFSCIKVEAARHRAQHDPHPTWKDPLL